MNSSFGGGPLRDFQRNLSPADGGTYSLAPFHSGATMPDPKLTDSQVEQIRTTNLTDTYWANVLGVNRTTVERARTGLTFSHLETPPRLEAAPRGGWKKLDIPCDFRPELISLAGEEWRPVVGWERHYRVSNLGRLYSLHQTGRFVVGMLVRGGYRILKLRDRDRRAHAAIHRLVLEAFVGPAPTGYQGCHGPHGVSDNALSNLRWDTKLSNHADKISDGTSLRGRIAPKKLTVNLVRQIRSDTETTDDQWAAKLGTTAIAIFQARTGKTWPNVDIPPQFRRGIR